MRAVRNRPPCRRGFHGLPGAWGPVARQAQQLQDWIPRANAALTFDKQIPVGDLIPGMFVSALDKPWTDTPFLLQGFLIRSEAEIAALTRTCKFVFVDPERCVGAARDRFRRPLVAVLPAKKNLWQKLLDLLPNGTSEKQRARGTESDECEVLDTLAVFRDTRTDSPHPSPSAPETPSIVPRTHSPPSSGTSR